MLQNFQILIRSPLKIKSLHLLLKFLGYIFNEKNEFENCHLKYSVSTLNRKLYVKLYTSFYLVNSWAQGKKNFEDFLRESEFSSIFFFIV